MLAIHPTLVVTQNPIADQTDYDEAAYVAVAKGLGAPIADVNSFVHGLPDWQSLLADGIHPAQWLSENLIHRVVAPAVARQVAVLRCIDPNSLVVPTNDPTQP
jgi:hypothetical protein